MKIILTHEQADFDGLASQLGAHLIDNIAIPVLPRRMNRNVRAFMTIYGGDLPFVDPRDFNGQEIEAVTLVDTQALTSIKGMSSKTQIKIIDHHSIKKDLPVGWDVVTEETGANTTIFVEAIEERYIQLDVVQATLLLLGIYEDTGSLTYKRTQPRDVRAAAFLLEQGASLTIADNFMNHPLSLAQQEIYDQLRKETKTNVIHGHTIIIADGDAREMDEELSTIAHKLRDLLDPDALFIVINVRGGVQLIARSTNDLIDVSSISEHFGGGGHPRAAAALIKNSDRSSVVAELNRILPNLIEPGITVAEIMSGTPHIIHLKTSIHDIAQNMQRYGYEGYPVVENDEIVGLVTRRAVDRALSHKLNINADNLMEAGQYHVHPDHGIEYLQNLMTDSGWGQIPVVDRESHKIIGIVTRTDLLKTLSTKTSAFSRKNLADILSTTLSPERLTLLRAIANIAKEQGSAIYIVGGFVRDLLLNRPSLDFDIVVEGDAVNLALAVKAKFGGRVTSHKKFGTAKWFMDLSSEFFQKNNRIEKNNLAAELELQTTLDFITARREFYTHPTALPTVESGSIKLDLHRRDFTINTLAIRLDGQHFGDLHDYWGGYNDLRRGLVRVLHSLSFIDDPTRMLRAVRYEQRYAFTLGQRTHKLLLAALPMLERTSGDRIRHEIDKIFAEENLIQIMDHLHELGILNKIHPDLIWDEWTRMHLTETKLPPKEWGIGADIKGIPLTNILTYIIWLVRLPFARAQKVTKRLRVSRVISENVLGACLLWEDLNIIKDAKPSICTSLLDKVPLPAIYAVYCVFDDKIIRSKLLTYITKWRYVTQITNGYDLEKRNLKPGPIYKEILSKLKDAWLDGDVLTPEDETEYLNDLMWKISKDKTDEPLS
jgi:tRNA nucleotidyltransferase (CCA-adding enzyme)